MADEKEILEDDDFVDIDEPFEDSDPTEEESRELNPDDFASLVIAPSDWTIETLWVQIGKQIDLDPEFQRRNVWGPKAKSRFIESLFLGIPIPQILLSAKPGQKNSYVVLDGKQRLLTIKEFLDGKLPNGNVFRLKDLRVLEQLEGKSWEDICEDDDWSFRLLNETQRSAVIRGWHDERVLYEIFHRLNSGSVRLSPMELRMSLHPGPFLKFIVKWTEVIGPLHKLINKKSPDPRMNDVEIAVRYLAFKFSHEDYRGDLKNYLDSTCEFFNEEFRNNAEFEGVVAGQLNEMQNAILVGINAFGHKHFCRKFSNGKYESRFNRAVFDVLVSSLSHGGIREFCSKEPKEFRSLFEEVSTDQRFARSIESTTKSISATRNRFEIWQTALEAKTGLRFQLPRFSDEIAD